MSHTKLALNMINIDKSNNDNIKHHIFKNTENYKISDIIQNAEFNS